MTLEERIAFLEGQVAGMGSRLDAFEQWKRGLVGVVEPVPPPEQAQEACGECGRPYTPDHVDGGEDHLFTPPEQARRTAAMHEHSMHDGAPPWLCGAEHPNHIFPLIRLGTFTELRPGERIVKSGSPIFDRIDGSANCGCSYDSIGSTLLYCAEHAGASLLGPGERIVSGEVYGPYGQHGEVVCECGHGNSPRCCPIGTSDEIGGSPDAPPRAEEGGK